MYTRALDPEHPEHPEHAASRLGLRCSGYTEHVPGMREWGLWFGPLLSFEGFGKPSNGAGEPGGLGLVGGVVGAVGLKGFARGEDDGTQD